MVVFTRLAIDTVLPSETTVIVTLFPDGGSLWFLHV